VVREDDRTPENRSTFKLCNRTEKEESEVPRKRYRPEEIIARLREAEVLPGQGKKVGEVMRAIGVSEVSYYRWRKCHDGHHTINSRLPRNLAPYG